MMDAVTLSLESWLRRVVPTAALCFDSPANEFPQQASGSAIRAFLYDVREEEHGRSGSMYLRDSANKVVARLQPVRILQYSYQLTSWAPGWQECYRVLGEVMRGAATYSAIPDECLHASLTEFRSGAVRLILAPPDPVPFPWAGTALPPSPVLHLQVIAPLQASADTDLEQSPEKVDIGLGATEPDREPLQRRVVRPRGRIEE
ncbi:Pvc16 family protein [Streptomyces sp. NPDC047981]|uniref:Pvc16 family protein n=1 Tax=Streptomyces sp. NPDC047981 TaxID=3154610 RepID=UPI0034352AE6